MPTLESILPPSLLDALEAHFERTAAHFAKFNEVSIQAIVLGGGYGRGEGGVYYTPSGEAQLYNDLDYFIFTNEPENPLLLAGLQSWAQTESRILGIDVEGKCLPLSHVAEASRSMMFFDLVSGHRVISGPKNILSEFKPLLDPSKLDLLEATRLLWNRGSGLYFAQCDLAKKQHLDVVHRNQSKAELALGDALLAVRGKYRAFAQERNELLHDLSDVDPNIVTLHDLGFAFKKRPTPVPSLDQLLARQAELTSLWLECFLSVESIRLKTEFTTVEGYADYRGRLYPVSSRVRNLLLAIRDHLKRDGSLHPMTDYPRGALQRSLVLLLGERTDFARVEKHLHQAGQSPSDFYIAYQRWWSFYS